MDIVTKNCPFIDFAISLLSHYLSSIVYCTHAHVCVFYFPHFAFLYLSLSTVLLSQFFLSCVNLWRSVAVYSEQSHKLIPILFLFASISFSLYDRDVTKV